MTSDDSNIHGQLIHSIQLVSCHDLNGEFHYEFLRNLILENPRLYRSSSMNHIHEPIGMGSPAEGKHQAPEIDMFLERMSGEKEK